MSLFGKMHQKKPRKAKRLLDCQRDIGKYRPNHWVCESCPDWDDINGCWKLFEDWRDCDFDEEEDLADEFYDIYWDTERSGRSHLADCEKC